jgi:hypothetical protein
MTENPNQSNQQLHPLGKLHQSYTPRVAPGKVMLGKVIFCAFTNVVEFVTAVKKYLSSLTAY